VYGFGLMPLANNIAPRLGYKKKTALLLHGAAIGLF
jgi:hypothetical protein